MARLDAAALARQTPIVRWVWIPYLGIMRYSISQPVFCPRPAENRHGPIGVVIAARIGAAADAVV